MEGSEAHGASRPSTTALSFLAVFSIMTIMSAQEIIAELPKLDPIEIQLLRERINQLQRPPSSSNEAPTGWGRAMLNLVGAADDLPPDLSLNHDHYLYGAVGNLR